MSVGHDVTQIIHSMSSGTGLGPIKAEQNRGIKTFSML